MLLILLLSSAINLAGCSRGINNYVLMKRSDRQLPCPIGLQASSDVNIFSIDDITFDLSYAMHSIYNSGKPGIDPDYYYNEYLYNYDVIYGLYIASERGYMSDSIKQDSYVEDIKNIENHHFIKMITEEEALSKEYLMIKPWFAYGYGFYKYNHTEKITIPKEFIVGNQGSFVIVIYMFAKPYWYQVLDYASIIFDYVVVDDDTVEIDMHDWKYFRIM